ncbi:MAG: cupin domain-containing protein [Firmicutes bacterium]|nr:cupin domain-containing protein [Bacillota bacterium]
MLGGSIRAKRLEKELSLRDVAQKTGLTASFLSQVERDLAEPSITSLRKIAEALEVPIFYFLMDADDQSPVVRRNSRKVLRLPESRLTYELLSPDLNRKIEMVMGNLAVSGATCDTPLTHPGEECILVLEGQARIDVGASVFHLEPGDSIYYFGSIPHRVTNEGTGELVFVMAITPPVF